MIPEPWAGQEGKGRAQAPWNHRDTTELQTRLPKTNQESGGAAGRAGRLCPAGKEVTLLLRKEQFKNIQLLSIYCLRLDVNVQRKLFPFHEVFDYLMERNSKQDRNISFFFFF